MDKKTMSPLILILMMELILGYVLPKKRNGDFVQIFFI